MPDTSITKHAFNSVMSHEAFDYEAYANSEPRQAIQKSLTAWLVALAPRKLEFSVNGESFTFCKILTYLKTFCSHILFSTGPTFWLGKSSLFSASDSHCFASGRAKTSFFSGSTRVSSSLRAAFPPMFRTRMWQSCGPYCFITALTKAATLSARSYFCTKTAYSCDQFVRILTRESSHTQK